jgi:hypothetical protein
MQPDAALQHKTHAHAALGTAHNVAVYSTTLWEHLMKFPSRNFAAALLAVCLITTLSAPTYAGIIGTQETLAEQSTQANRDKVRDFLNRADVEKKLQAMDVPAAEARIRVDALTPAEAATLAQRIDSQPAGGALSGTDFVIILLVAILVALIL